MSSTSIRRPRPAPRPSNRTNERGSRAAQPESFIHTEPQKVYASPLERAFPIPHLSIDVLIAGGLILVSLLLRLWGLGDRPLHHDESLHATYGWYLMGRADPEYHYDPMMHGPLQFHMIAFFYSIFGSSPFSARLWSVATGTALVAAPLLLRPYLGRWTTYTLMIIFALSPACLYFSRFAREDMQFAFLTFMIVASLLRYILDKREGLPRHYNWLYLLAVSFVLAYAAKESIYLVAAILGAFIAIELCRELVFGAWWIGPAVGVLVMAVGLGIGHLAIAALGAVLIVVVLLVLTWSDEEGGLVADALRSTPAMSWGLAGAIFLGYFLLLYWPIGSGDAVSWGFVYNAHTVATNLEIPNKGTVPYTYSTDGLLGGLLYWQAQEPVARGGQPWYYYLLIIPLYEWLPVLFGIIGGVWILLRRRTFLHLFLLWWTVATFLIYGWTTEKMPWNALHLVVPLSVLAAIGLVVSVQAIRYWVRYVAIAAAVLAGVVTVHNSVTLAYVNGASPHEYYVYVQTAPDMLTAFNEMERIRTHLGNPTQVVVDNEETWPWVFYLRDSSHWTTTYASKPADYGVPTQPILLVDDSNYPALKASLALHYVSFEMRLRWWNPEEYKTYASRTDNSGNLLPRLSRFGYFVRDALSPSTWGSIMQWEIGRQPFSPHAWDNFNNSKNFYFCVKNDLIPYLSPDWQAKAKDQVIQQQLSDPFLKLNHQIVASTIYGASGTGAAKLTNVGALAVDAQNHLLVADNTAHDIKVYAADGTLLRAIGSAGSGPGQFKAQYNPSVGGIAVGPNGAVYATDTWDHRVEEFTAAGDFIRAWGGPNTGKGGLNPSEFYGPRGIAVAPNGNVYVADTGNKRIQVFNAAGKFLFTFGASGSQPGQFNEPSSVAVDGQGKVYVADYWNERIQVFDLQGHPLLQIPVVNWQGGGYLEPYISVDATGRIYAPDPLSGRIMVFSATGKPLTSWGQTGNGSGQFNSPISIAVGSDGSVFVGDSANNRVQQFPAP